MLAVSEWDPAKVVKLVLVAENEAIIAMAIADELSDAGFQTAGPFPTCVAASRWLQDNTPDFAILDIELQDGPCTEVARELRRRDVEFAVFSGSQTDEAPPIFAEAPWFEKPTDLKELIASLTTAGAGT